MSIENEFGFIGHCYDIENNHDKIWGYFYRPTPGYEEGSTVPYYMRPLKNICIFWARRGKAMQFKGGVENSDVRKLVQSKMKKGYKKIGAGRLIEIWPTFISEAEGKLMWEVLSGNVK